MMKRSILRWELSGIAFIFIVGFPWHYVFGWLGGWRPAALVFPVNESVWEHTKLCFWPALIWALIEYPFIGRRTAGFWAAKAAGLLTMVVLMAVLFYGYLAVLGRSVLWANLLDFADRDRGRAARQLSHPDRSRPEPRSAAARHAWPRGHADRVSILELLPAQDFPVPGSQHAPVRYPTPVAAEDYRAGRGETTHGKTQAGLRPGRRPRRPAPRRSQKREVSAAYFAALRMPRGSLNPFLPRPSPGQLSAGAASRAKIQPQS